jgi:AcrR family transcriptional regulator
MKRNSRDSLIEATRAIALESGFEGLTFEAITAKTGLTRSGIVYHFPLHELLVEEVCKVLAREWDVELQGHLAKSFEAATPQERARAYLAASAAPIMPRLFRVIADPLVRKLDPNPWDTVMAKWAPPPSSDSSHEELEDLFLMRVIADGLYAYPVVTGQPTTPEAIDAVLRRTSRLLEPSPTV